ncbi:MAG: VanZ family protein [Planctomycetes bacterium]|nr:VanZ family protein [Planctomycetota bacterium]
MPRALAPLCVLAWGGVIWLASSIQPPTIGQGDATGAILSNFLHAPEFGVLTLCVCLCLPRKDGWARTDAWRLQAIFVVVFVYAIVDEAHQGFTPHRDPSVCDVLTDATAATCVLLAVRFGGGEHANVRNLSRTIAYGLLACLACACIASFVPELVPQWEWL